VGLFFAEWKTVVSGIVLLIGGKVTLFDSTAPQWPILCTFHTCCDNVSGYLH